MNRTKSLLAACACASVLCGQQLSDEQKQRVDQALPGKAPARPRKPRRLLVTSFAKVGDRLVRGHPSIPAATYAIEQMGKRTGAYEAVFSNDVEMFRPAKLREFDAVCFNNTQGVLFEAPELRKSLLDFVTGGHGLVGFHAVIATFVQHPVYDQWPPFGRMVGGTENGGHPWMPTDSFTFKVDDPTSPLNAVFKGKGFEVNDEVMQLQEPDLRSRFHVLLSIDMAATKPPSHRLLPVREQDKDFPLTWIRSEGKGRVFVSGMGHNPNVFWIPALLEHFLAGIQYALGDLNADATPSASSRGR